MMHFLARNGPRPRHPAGLGLRADRGFGAAILLTGTTKTTFAQRAPSGPPASDGASAGSSTGDKDADTAQQLSNPLASLISVPLQSNFDWDWPSGTFRYTANLQPVIPIRLNGNLNLISRTIVPIVATRGRGDLGNVVESLFLSPHETPGGLTFGAGPVIQLPTRTWNALGSNRLGLGPTAVVVQKKGAVLFGLLVNHLWSVGHARLPADRLDATFIQPFASYIWPTKTTLIVNTESSYDWARRQWTVPINVFANQLLTIGQQRVQVGIGPRYFAQRPDGGPRWGVRLNLAPAFPEH